MIQNIKYLFKLLKLILLLGLFDVICSLGNLVFIPILLLGLQRYEWVKMFSRTLIFYAWKSVVKFINYSNYMEIEFQGFEGLGEKGEVIIANHPSILDALFLLSKIPQANCILKSSLNKNPFLFGAIRASGYIQNDFSEKVLEDSIQSLQKNSLLIFPEGTRTEKSIIFHKAAFYIAIKGGLKLTPIFIHMKPTIFGKKDKWYKISKQKTTYTFKVAQSIDLKSFYPDLARPKRIRLLYEEVNQIYTKEFK